MNFISSFIDALNQFKQRRLAPSSLQFRLTAGITAASMLGLGGVATWTGWTMQQLLIVSHVRAVEAIAERLPHDIELYSEMLPMETAVQKAIDTSSVVNLFIWVKRADGTTLAQSAGLQKTRYDFATMLMALSSMPIRPRVYQVDQHYLVLCSSTLTVQGKELGQLYLAQDISIEQEMLLAVLRNVTAATILVIILLTAAISIYIKRSLLPLRQMSQIAETISAEDLHQAQLYLDRAPDEVQELARMLNAMLSRLSQSWEQQRQFVSNVSHELRTPLSVVYGYLQSVLRRGATLSDSHREAIEISLAETERIIRLLKDLLDLARVESGNMHFYLEPVVLNDLVIEVVGMVHKFSDRQVQIEASNPMVQAKIDRDRMVQVLINLIDNAVKYSEPPEPITVTLSQNETHATIQVSDRGCGIPLQKQARIFERFYRANEDRARTTGGVGLGLSIVKSLVEGMGGRVSVWSEPDKGSTFTIYIPFQ